MDAHPITVDNVLSGQKQYVIPVFQRTYEWGSNRWETLWKDLYAIYEESDRGLNHFIGPMVIFAHTFPHEVPKYLVIDGQQRLMTLTVLLAALRDRAKALGFTKIANAINSNALFFLNTKGENVAKIIPRIKDRDALFNILKSNITDVDQNFQITQAYHYFYNQLEQITPVQPSMFDDPTDTVLDKFYTVIIQRLKVIMISLDATDNPSNIYESLNFKHETLTDAALIRNYVFMKAGSLEEQEKFEDTYWRDFEDLFKFANYQFETLTDFYYRYLTSKTEYMARKRLYSAFTAYVDSFLEENSLIQLATELARYAHYYIAIVHKSDDPELQAAFERFRQLEAETAIPLLLALYDKYAYEKSINKTNFLRMIRMIESFVLRRYITRERTRGYGLTFAVACKNINNPTELANYLADRVWPDDKSIKEALKSYEFYRRTPKQCRLVLTEVERSFGHKEKVKLDDADVQIEHVMPQNLTQSWRQMLGDNADDIHLRLLHTLGNLTLTGYNVELGDKPYAEKRLEYRKSHLSLNEYFERKDKWTEKEILERSDALFERFVDLWDRPNFPQRSFDQRKKP